jgi:hypothetical protein
LSVRWFVCLFVRLFVCPSFCLSVRPFVCLFVRLFVCSSVCLSVRPFVCLFVRLFVCSSVCLSVRPFVCLFVRLFVCSSVCLSVRPSVCLKKQKPDSVDNYKDKYCICFQKTRFFLAYSNRCIMFFSCTCDSLDFNVFFSALT